MKKILITMLMTVSFQVFSQNQKKIIFEFDNKADEIVYRKNTNNQEVSGFKFMINNKKIFFSSNPISSSNKLTINTSREQLNSIVQNDNANKNYYFVVYLKDKKKSYAVDHLVRKITCE
ncbi:hypothetical protein JI750_08820 [Flavobacterium sp. GN10]|uniref:Uncharacterized protein n=1 Tax=Flavobacterium tagetis TaxID=2801336 RepID=A0ABS1KCS6_9FLAO|nr:hypothetical protein [Flavobacterium tagetis]MBL0736982.1 hypothetical protein [Flavobacterium tagetis]